ncbi:MAG: beta-ketoacyl-ACP synthase II [Dehalococcoidia bacterium]|nr:beta-ketoacyl-ACP synthase II [Dehalococcoidia bacterium]
MSMKRRVVITGMGTVNPLGIGVEQSWQALCEGRSGISVVTRFDCSGMRTTVGGEVRGFNARDFLPEKLARRTDRFQHFALAAAHMAIEDSKLSITADIAERVGVSIGTAFGGVESATAGQDQFRTGGREEISPFFVPMLLTGMAAGQVAMRFGAKGPNYSLTTACSAGTHSIGESCRIIQRGEADVMLAGGSEAPLVPVLNQCFGIMGATTAMSDPARASRPFDADRDGFVPAEGSGVLVLEDLESALRRDAFIYAEIVGFAATADAYHVTSPSPGGEGAVRCMRLALKDACMQPEHVDYINAHGTSTKLNDSTETQAVKTVFGDHASHVPLSSNKSMIGHTMGASGAIEAIFSILTIRNGTIPPTINYTSPDPECDLDCVPNVARQQTVKTVMSNSFGFGGVNGSLILRAY